jgi:uncharacterized protein YbjT (DUF2867 family)
MILITGANGNVGGEVLKEAVAARLDIRAAYHSAAKAKSAPAAVPTVLMDYKDPGSIRAALAGVEKAFLVGPPARDVAQLEGGFVEQARASGLKHIVYLSAMGGRAAIFPGLHRDTEEKIEACGIPYTFLRPNGFMQNLVIYNSGTINAESVFYGSQGDGAVSHIDVRDVAAVAVRVLSSGGHEGKAYSLTGPQALSNAQLAEKLSLALARKIRYVDLAPEAYKKGLLAAGVPQWPADAVVDLNRFYREGGASHVEAAIERLLRRKARSFDDFARDYSSAFQVPALGRS